jgi:hypothetical protein
MHASSFPYQISVFPTLQKERRLNHLIYLTISNVCSQAHQNNLHRRWNDSTLRAVHARTHARTHSVISVEVTLHSDFGRGVKT